MNWFVNLQTRTKLLVTFGLMILFLLVVSGIAYWGIGTIRESQRHLFENDMANAIDLLSLQSHENALRADMLTLALASEPAERARLIQEVQQLTEEVDGYLAGLQARNSDDPQFLQQLNEFREVRDAYRQTRETELFSLIESGQTDEVLRLTEGIQNDRYLQMRDIIADLGTQSFQRAQNAVADTQALTNTLAWLFIVISLGVLLIGIFLTIFLNRLIADPLQEVTAAVQQIGAGNLSVELKQAERNDEVGVLIEAFTRMVASLRLAAAASERISDGDLTVQIHPDSDHDVLGKALARMVENLRRMNSDITDSVQVLSSSAAEILASVSQLAASTTETATAISETTATVEQIKQASQINSQKARQVSEGAQRAEQISKSGKKAVDESIEGIQRVQMQMQSIAESLARLSEQGQSIGEIMVTVNDLAEQSNLLAVNAAIEAAKAGEQGRGFAVVAQEVRNLAAQSKQATAQVRMILNDVQKATTEAVMAAEQGSRIVEMGIRQTADAGGAIQALTETISQASQAATQIAASSQQQLAGMDQAVLAMDNIRQASAQNVAGTKQLEISARDLHEIGQKLAQLVAQYRV